MIASVVSVNGEMMSIRIRHSKNDQLRQGDEVVVTRTWSQTYPVAVFERYLQRVGMTVSDSRSLFWAIQKTKNGESLWESGKISYTCLCSLYLKKLRSLGFPAQEFALHDIRSGDATAANANVPYFSRGTGDGKVRTLKMGMWRIVWKSGWRSQGKLDFILNT